MYRVSSKKGAPIIETVFFWLVGRKVKLTEFRLIYQHFITSVIISIIVLKNILLNYININEL